MKKRFLLLFAAIFISVNISAQVYSAQEAIPAGHWIYDALYCLTLEQKKLSTLDNAPLTVAELYLNFQQINKDSLSEDGKALYEKTENFFERKKFLFDFNGAKFTVNAILNPVGVYKTNKDVDWSYATSYTDDSDKYVTTNSVGTVYTQPLATFPFILDFGEIAYISVDPYAGAGPFWALTSDNYATNIPTGSNGGEFFMWPFNGYASVSKTFNTWGIGLNVGRQGLEVGRTATGSLIYDSSFQTDFYAQLNVYSPRLKYTMDVAQVDQQRYFYLHSAEIVPFNWIKLGIVEGTLIKSAFELRFLNPLLFMHTFSGWIQYANMADSNYKQYYGEYNYCAYFGLTFDITPCPNLRIYGLYAQNEIQSLVELVDDYSRSIPDSLGGQLGVEYTIPIWNGFLKSNLEAVYTTPFCYLKQTSSASLMRLQIDSIGSYGLGTIGSWMGSQFGPDALAGLLSAEYNNPGKMKVGLKYLFVAHGVNSFALFNKTREISGNTYESYYPSAMYLQGEDAEKTKAMRTNALTPTIQYTNQITANFNYTLFSKLEFGTELSYIFIFNNKAKEGVFVHGLELSLSAKYTLF